MVVKPSPELCTCDDNGTISCTYHIGYQDGVDAMMVEYGLAPEVSE